MSQRPRFHLAFGVTDLDATRQFYVGAFGCRVGRSADRWIDFDLRGHQLSAHLLTADEVDHRADVATNLVDGDDVPARHFGLILPPDEWDALKARLVRYGARFLIEPRVRFEGEPGEQRTMFVLDPSGNAIEIKSFADDDDVFADSQTAR
jgi:extradiol dioxygenase family protein